MYQWPQGSKQHLALAAPATRARTQQPRKYRAVHAAELAVESNFQSFDDIADHCSWNTLVDQPWKIMSIARRDWAAANTQSEDGY
jgi:hypothetical protein